MKALVIGAGGFVGRHLTKRLDNMKSISYYAPSKKVLDLSRAGDLHKAISGYRPDVIINLAVDIGGLGYSSANNFSQMVTNLKMYATFFDELSGLAAAGIMPKLINVISACIYPGDAPQPLREADIPNGNPVATNLGYGLSKRMQLYMGELFGQKHKAHVVNLIPVNIYGEWDDFGEDTSHVLPAMIRKMLSGATDQVEVWGDGTTIRELMYADDFARVIIESVIRDDLPVTMNVGSGHEVSVTSMIEKISTLTGIKKPISLNKDRPVGQKRRHMELSLFRRHFPHFHFTPFEIGLRNTINWYKQEVDNG
jgi:GDP-L-fucose synthase